MEDDMRRKGGIVIISLVAVLLVYTVYEVSASVPEYAPAVEWSRTYVRISDYPSVEPTSDGGYIASCLHRNTTGRYCWVEKIDSVGNVQWSRTYGGNWENFPDHVWQTSDGGYITVGYALVNGSAQAWLLKALGDGAPEWNRTYGNRSWAEYAEQTSDGGYILGGEREVLIYGRGLLTDRRYPFMLVKMDSNGNPQWNRTYNEYGNLLLVHQEEDGGYAALGLVGMLYESNFILLKIDAAGNVMWSQTYGSSVGFASAATTSDGGYIMAGIIGPLGSGNLLLVKVGSNGTVEWQQTNGEGWTGLPIGIRQTSDGGYVLAGHPSTTRWGAYSPLMVKTDGRGVTEWVKRTWDVGGYGADAKSVVESPEGGYVVAGLVEGPSQPGGSLWIMKLASTPSHEPTAELVFGSLAAAIGFETASLLVLTIVLVDSALNQRHRRRAAHTAANQRRGVSA